MTLGVRVVARAKLTLSLRVLGRRPDGYHDLEALAVSLEEPYDVISLRLRPAFGVAVRLSGRAVAGVPAGEANLAVQAARLLLEAVDDEVSPGAWAAAGLEVALHKGIPAKAGLGGGSADAAATLFGGARLLGLELDGTTITGLGARLGSDVPFCLSGGAGWIRGRGDVIDPVPTPAPLPMVVAVPSFGVSTPAVYEAWDHLGGPRAKRACPAPPALAELFPDGLVNDLEPAAEAAEPRLVHFRDALEGLAGRPAVLAGSGSAYVVHLAVAGEAAALANEVAATLDVAAVFATRPVSRGLELQGALA
jgi:4-diphosphocytidyl-2-C-methyl-D-erythritol kinase